MKNEVKKSLDSFITKQVKDVKDVKGGGLNEVCYIIVGGQMIYC